MIYKVSIRIGNLELRNKDRNREELEIVRWFKQDACIQVVSFSKEDPESPASLRASIRGIVWPDFEKGEKEILYRLIDLGFEIMKKWEEDLKALVEGEGK